MHWFTIAIIAPICWAIVNHIDKYLLEKHFKNHGVGSLILYSSLFGGIMLPIAYNFDNNIFGITGPEALILILIGILTGIVIYAYLNALKDEETSLVVPIYQTIPIFGFIFALLLLNEKLTPAQGIAGILILLGSFILSLEFAEERKFKLKWKPLLLMLLSSALYGFHEVLFKLVTSEASFWVSIFWLNIGLLLFGMFILTMRQRDRGSFFLTLKKESVSIIVLNFLSESLTMAGTLALLYATLLAPVALVQTTAGYQPAIVLILGILLTILFPRIATEKISKQHLLHKSLSIGIILIGSFLLYT